MDTTAGHMENTLKTNWEHMGKYVCERSTNLNSIVDIWGSMCERETEGDRERLWSNLKCKIKPQNMCDFK